MSSSEESDPKISFDLSEEDVWEPSDDQSSDDDENVPLLSPANAARDSRIGGYYCQDNGRPGVIPKFRPERRPGLHIQEEVVTRGGVRHFLQPLDFFKLYFTTELVSFICKYTNMYAAQFGPSKPSLYKGWYDLTPDEFYKFCGLIFYMGIVQISNVNKFWSTKSLYHGLWARAFMPRHRYYQIMAFLKVSNFTTENTQDKLCKVRFLFEYIQRKCRKLYQPSMNISVDERMVANKGRYSFRQYIRDKPTKWGMKLWVLADSETGYTYNFDVYLGKKEGGAEKSTYGQAYDVVMNLMKPLFGQGYRLFFDNFYTSVQLLKDLLKEFVCACGTVLANRKGFPPNLRDVKKFEKNSDRGDMRWVRTDEILTVQWRDNKTVTIMSNYHVHSPKDLKHVKRRTKVGGQFRELIVRQPQVINDYNLFMGGVDKSDQLINKYNSLRKTSKFWKTLFYHFLDIARVNSFILFQSWRKEHPDIDSLSRPQRYLQPDFTEELVSELGSFDTNSEIPSASNAKKDIHTSHEIVPEFRDAKRNCKLCYDRFKKEFKVKSVCATCNTYLHFTPEKNCLLEFHRL